jgi:hypothetical protein
MLSLRVLKYADFWGDSKLKTQTYSFSAAGSILKKASRYHNLTGRTPSPAR